MKTLYEKIWDQHLVASGVGRPDLLYIDLHLIHEVTSPQAFAGLRSSGRRVRRPDLTFATIDHAVPTKDRHLPMADKIAANQIEALRKNCRDFDITLFDIGSSKQGIVHVLGPELGLTRPGMTIVCGDSHTATHGAFGALAFGIGTSEVEHVLATQTLPQQKSRNLQICIDGKLQPGVTAKDVILTVINRIGTAGGTGFVIEYCGEVIRSFSMESRMTVCNMSIEAGARAGLIAPDDITFSYLNGRQFSPKDENRAVEYWKTLTSDSDAKFDALYEFDGSAMAPIVTWGTSPEMSAPIDSIVPDPDAISDSSRRSAYIRALEYMDLEPGTSISAIQVDRVFIGSCTNSRIEDLRLAAAVVAGRKISPRVRAMVVPGSTQVKQQAENEGLARIFVDAGFEWRDPGCSMCLAMNNDVLAPGERCASTSNRNFEGRQGRGGRTHLVSPARAAAAAIAGHFVDVREFVAKKTGWNNL
mgnify:CR=1 FL=1